MSWQPAVPKFKGELLIKRLNRWYVGLEGSSDERSPIDRTRVFDLKIKNKPLAADIDGFPWAAEFASTKGTKFSSS